MVAAMKDTISLFRKLGVRTRTEAVAKAAERRLDI